jgi:acyl-CoA synthetase (AMP-forming)/AMP-acid ligase II
MRTRDLIARLGLNYPTKTAIIEGNGGRKATWRDLDRRANAFALALQKLGVQKGDAVAILSHEHIEVYEHWFAILKLGAIRVAVNWRYAPREMMHILYDSGAKVCLIDADSVPSLQNHFSELQEKGILLMGYGKNHGLPLDYETLIQENQGELELPPLQDDDVLLLSYTSGTTGLPKGVMLTEKGIYTAILHTALSCGLMPDDIWYTPAANAWITIVLNSLFLANGMTMVIPNGDFEARSFLQDVEEAKVSVALLVPTMLRRVLEILQENPFDLSSLRMLMYGSAPTPPALVRQAKERLQCDLMHIYGLTEVTGGWVSFLTPKDHARAFSEKPALLPSCGRPGLHFEVSIRDPYGQILPCGEHGEIWLKTDTMMKGYLHLPKQTAEVLKDGWFRTNDIGRMDEEGYLYLTDRQKFLIISGAANVFPSAVEAVLAEHPLISEAAVVGIPHPEWGEAVVAAVKLMPSAKLASEELIAFCKERLGRWEVPKYIEFDQELPKGITGKLDKKKLQENLKNKVPWRTDFQ